MAGEAVGINLPVYNLSSVAVTERNAQYPGDPFTDDNGDGSYNTYLGCNRAGACAPGIGINSGNMAYLTPQIGNENPQQFTLEDQAEAARIPQDSQHIGGVAEAVTPGGELAQPVVPNFTPAVIPVNMIVDPNGTPDFNNTANMVVVDTVAAPGAEMDSVSGAVNRSNVTTAVGDIAWGDVPVA